MIPRPVEVRAHTLVDFERSSGPWTLAGFLPTYIQLLLLCAAFLLCLLLHMVRFLHLHKTGAGSTSPTSGLTVSRDLADLTPDPTVTQDDSSIASPAEPTLNENNIPAMKEN